MADLKRTQPLARDAMAYVLAGGWVLFKSAIFYPPKLPVWSTAHSATS